MNMDENPRKTIGKPQGMGKAVLLVAIEPKGWPINDFA